MRQASAIFSACSARASASPAGSAERWSRSSSASSSASASAATRSGSVARVATLTSWERSDSGRSLYTTVPSGFTVRYTSCAVAAMDARAITSMGSRNLIMVDSLERLVVSLAGANPDRLRKVVYKYLAVADLAGARGVHDRLEHALERFVGDGQFKLDLGQEIHHVLGAPIEFSVAFLAPESLDFRHSNALHPEVRQRLADVVELEGLDDGADHFHRDAPGARSSSTQSSIASRAL